MRNITKFLMLVVLCLVGMQGNAQNVTVHPGNGSMLPALKAGNSDTFFGWNGFATWKHEQLSLTLTTGDSDNNSGTDEDGNLARPANDIFASADGKCLQIGKGNSLNTYITVSLPKGYRFTGYTIQFHRISEPNGASGSVNNYNGNIAFGETNSSFAYTSTTNTTDGNITTYRGGIGQNNTTQYTIGRTSPDMENVLYFMLYNGAVNGRAFIQLDFVEFYFTAENNYTPLIPAPNVTEQSAVDIPFTTSKMDYGELKRYNINGTEVETGGRVSYDGTIHDMNANLTLYEDGSVKSVTNNGFDGTAGYIVDYKAGSISQAGDYFKLDADKHGNLTANNEAIYYIESPIWAVNSAAENANKNPIGYRIIGADFDYTGGNLKFPAVFKIQYESTGHSADQNGTYGLNFYNNALAYNWNYQTEWRIDDDGYIYVGNTYLRAQNTYNNAALSTTTNKSNATRFRIVNNQIQMISNTSYYIGWREQGSGSNITRSAVVTNTTNRRATYNELSHAFEENIRPYTFNIYDKTGTRVEKTVTVNGTSGTLSIDGLNNDAVKIGVIGTGVIKGHIIMQALDPYIDHIDIVCQEQGTNNGGKLTQQFTATDFSVRGGKFTFYVPEDFTFPAQFTFENLYSKYGDETYYNTPSTNHGRYFFMGSPYGDSNDNVYGRSESASYTTKINCLKPGDKKFTFNNAATATANPGTQYEEYPFSKALYRSKVNGSFTDFIFTQDEMTNGTTKTAYLFTCDETRYNIAPTTALQHVYYAYYEMTIDMKKKTYVPLFAWEKLYDKTFYGNNQEDAMWGLKITTETVHDDQGDHSGYVTVSQIKDYINGREASGTEGSADYVPAIPSALTGNNAPSSLSQILYIDGSNLMNIVENQKDNVSHKVSELKEGLATNALIYLPYGSTNSDDNFAYNTIAQYGETPIFRGSNNIVLTDKNPFYSKYDIQVDAAKYAKYSRQISRDDYGKAENATLILPFALNLPDEDGVHTNTTADGCSFSLNIMDSGKTITQTSSDPSYEISNVVFKSIEGSSSEANKPYVVNVLKEAGGDDNSYSFVATQYGGNITKTPTQGDNTALGQLFYTGETADGTYQYISIQDCELKTVKFNCTAQGNYSGVRYARSESENIFYFANNMFINLHTLSPKYDYLRVYPFRSVYTYTGDILMNYFNAVFDDELGSTDAIAEMPKHVDLAVRSGKGYLSMTSAIDQTVSVRSLNGMSVGELNMRAGDSQSINLPAGIYLVNNVKIIVK